MVNFIIIIKSTIISILGTCVVQIVEKRMNNHPPVSEMHPKS